MEEYVGCMAAIMVFDAYLAAVHKSIDIMEEKKPEDIEDKKILRIMEKSRQYGAAINYVMTMLIMIMGIVCTMLLIGIGLDMPLYEKILLYVVGFIVVTYLVSFFGNSIPKRVAVKYHERILKNTYYVIRLVYIISAPFSQAVYFSTSIFQSIFGLSTSLESEVTQEEIMKMLDEGEEKGTIDESEKEMINNVFEFNDEDVSDIIIHRKDVVSVSIDEEKENVMRIMVEEGYSRVPVYEENIDNIIGIVYIKDIFKQIYYNEEFDMKSILRKPIIVPETKKISELFKQMQKEMMPMCIVVDEYGGTAGIVTMEDIVEEVMGNILDEYDVDEKPDFIQMDDGNYLIYGIANLDDTAEKLGLELPEAEFDTIGGFLISEIGRIPEGNEKITVEYGGYNFTILDTDENRISAIRAEKIKDEEDKENEEDGKDAEI